MEAYEYVVKNNQNETEKRFDVGGIQNKKLQYG